MRPVRHAGVVMVALVMALTAGLVVGGNLPVRHVVLSTSGALEVISAEPGAWVKVNGELFGRTPLKVAGLPPGPAQLEVGVQGKPLLAQTVNIPQGETVRVAVPSARDRAMGALMAWLPQGTGMRVLLAQPWAYAAAALTGLAVVSAGVLWTSSPQRLPLVGRLPVDVSDTQWNVLRWTSLAAVGALGAVTLVLFILPGIPALAALAGAEPATP